MTSSSSGREPLEKLAEEFAERFRRGERPALTEYVEKHPELAEEIRDLFPALVEMEELRPAAKEATGPYGGRTDFKSVPPQLGDYRILREVSHGGMGIVYEAVQESLGRHVALKVLPFHSLSSTHHLERFRREARAAAKLHHTNIVPVFGVGEHEGVHYYAMQFIQGHSLNDVLYELKRLRQAKRDQESGIRGQESEGRTHKPGPNNPTLSQSIAQGLMSGQFKAEEAGQPKSDSDPSPLSPRSSPLTPRPSASSELTTQSETEYSRSVARVGVQVADALAYAHQQGILHRDIKPSNLLLDTQGTIWVTDFGLVKEEGSGELTSPGDIVGTLRYMAPERFQGHADPRSDVYGLGLTLFEMLTLTPAFEDTDRARLMDRVQREEPPPPRKIDPRIPRDLETIVLKAIAKEPGGRYATAAALADDLRRFLADRPIQARRTAVWERTWRWCRRNPAVASLTAAVAVTVLLAVVGLVVSNLRISEEKDQKDVALRDKDIALKDKEYQLWQALVAQARANRLSRRAGQRFETLEILQRATGLARTLDLPAEKIHELRNAVIATLALPDLHLAGPWNPLPVDAYSFDFDEAHEIYARADRQGNCSIRRVADDAEIHRLPGLGRGAPVYLSRDGKFVAVFHSGILHLWKLDEAPARRILSEKGGCHVDFRRDGQEIAVAYEDGAIGLFELPSGRQLGRPLAPDTLTREIAIALHPTEPVVAVFSYFGSVVQLRDVRTGKVLASLPQGSRPLSIAWHPDGRTLAVGMAEGGLIRLYERATLQPIRALQADQAVSSLAFNHVGDRLAATGWNGFVELFDLGTGQKLFATTPLWGTQRFSRDDRRLAGSGQDGKLGIWQVGDSREYRTLVREAAPEKAAYYGSVSVDPNGRLLAAAMSDGFGLWDLASGSELAFIPAGGESNLVLFEPSGTLLTLCPAGLFRWPIRVESVSRTDFKSVPRSRQWIIGPPERLPLPRGSALGQSLDGRVIVTCSRAVGAQQASAGGWVLHTDRPGPPIRLDAGADVSYIAVSPDGRWVITVNHNPHGLAKIWDACDGRQVKSLAEWGTGYPRFSPDGRWLSTCLDGGRLFALGSWEPGPQVGDDGTFAPDGKLMAVETNTGVIRLVDPATSRELAVLEDPNLELTGWPVFTPDGTKLISASNGKVKGIHMWDLRLIREHLAKMHLDWDAPPYPPVDPGSNAAEPRPTAHVVGAELLIDWAGRGVAFAEQGQWDKATADFEKAKQLTADDAQAWYRLALVRLRLSDREGYRKACAGMLERFGQSANVYAARWTSWTCALAPEAVADWGRVITLAEINLAADPKDCDKLQLLGAALYRAGRFEEAAKRLTEADAAFSKAANPTSSVIYTWLFQAMAQHRLGHAEEARRWLKKAVQDLGQPPPERPQDGKAGAWNRRLTLQLFRREAEELLGIKEPPPELLPPPTEEAQEKR